MGVILNNQKYTFNLLFVDDQIVIAWDEKKYWVPNEKTLGSIKIMGSKHELKKHRMLNFRHEKRSRFRRKSDKKMYKTLSI